MPIVVDPSAGMEALGISGPTLLVLWRIYLSLKKSFREESEQQKKKIADALEKKSDKAHEKWVKDALEKKSDRYHQEICGTVFEMLKEENVRQNGNFKTLFDKIDGLAHTVNANNKGYATRDDIRRIIQDEMKP